MNDTHNRLKEIYPFDDEVLNIVNNVAESELNLSWSEYQSKFNVPEVQTFEPTNGKSIQVLDIKPKDYNSTIIYHAAMGNSVDPNLIMHVLPFSRALPDRRIIATGNPSRLGNGYGKLSINDAQKVYRGDLRPVVHPILEYINNEGIDKVSHVGYSYGADKVLASVQYSHQYDHSVSSSIVMEPASVKKRNMLSIAKDFKSTEEYLNKYINETNSKPFLEARKESGGLLGYSLGLLRISNLAITSSLTMDKFQERAESALLNQSESNMSIMWGSESELAIHGLMVEITSSLKEKFGDRVQSICLEGQRHAMCDDIYFYCAIILQGMKQIGELFNN